MKNWSDKLILGDLALKNRVVLAALTRERCDRKTNIPCELVAEYYAQRAGAGFMLT
jgi:N-ethylmaleimide reductase